MNFTQGHPAVAFRDESQRVHLVRSNDTNGNTWVNAGVVATNSPQVIGLGLCDDRPFVFVRPTTPSAITFTINDHPSGFGFWSSPLNVRTNLLFPYDASINVIQGQPAAAYVAALPGTRELHYIRNLTVPSSQINWIATGP